MSGLHSDSKLSLLSSRGKIPVSTMSAMEHQSESSNIPILMGIEDNIYQGALTDSQECFVLVDDRSVRVMPAGSTVRLLSEQQSSVGGAAEKTVQVMHMGSDKALEMLEDSNKQSIEVVHMNDGRTVEVLPIEDGKTVEVVQMDGEKTIEVMHVNAVKHSEVIHVDGSSSIELLSVGDALKGPALSSSPTAFTKSNENLIFSTQSSAIVSSISMKRTLASNSVPHTGALSLGTLAPVNPSIVITTPKSRLPLGPQFSAVPSVTTLVNSRQSQVIESDLESFTQVTPSIILSSSKKMMTESVDGLDDAIIISWPPMSPKVENSVAIQTELYASDGPSLNLFLCTFHANGDVETQCDMPVLKHVSVSTSSGKRCGPTIFDSHEETNDNLAIKPEIGCSDTADSRYSRSGRPLKLKDSFFRSFADFVGKGEYYDSDLDENDLNSSHGNEEGNAVLRKKRKQKKKRRRYPSSDDYDMDFNAIDNAERIKSSEEAGDVVVKEEPINDDEDEELALNILKTKGYGLRTKRRLKKLNDMHYMEEKGTKKKIEGRQKFTCQSCSEVFPTFTRLQRHAKEEHNSTDFAFPCDQCGAVFTRPHNLDRHKETKHGDGEKRFACEHCGRRFGRQDVLSVHISMVHFKKSLQSNNASAVFGPNIFHCTGCDQFFSKEQKLQNHRQGDLTCNDCKLSFECKSSLRAHQYKNHPTSCSECGKLCNNKQQMYLHRLTHDPKYVCKYCNKGFLWKSQYSVHLSTHTGEKPVVCDICGKSFAHKLAVNKHKWQDHNDNNKKFKCQTCGKCFVYKGKLQSHIRSHTGEKPFLCNLCPSSFTQRCNLTAHIRSVHGVYIQSIESDGTTQTQLVKYKRVKKTMPIDAQPTVVNAVMTQAVETAVAEQSDTAIQEQVQMPESFETAAAVYQIVYAYQQ